jgi:phytoene dehydrogenase-like protein
VKHPLLQQVFSFHPLLVGGNPFQSSSIYAMIHYLERKWGVHFAMGGTGALVQGLLRLFTEMGGKLRLNTRVEEVLVEDGTAVAACGSTRARNFPPRSSSPMPTSPISTRRPCPPRRGRNGPTGGSTGCAIR